ncbi:DnaK family protein [Opisthorchis viverrini]|uniref:DnaK family protein n=1 Tax=Opisthorchis viverrini TaxID=6198 RepID=A0A1S8X5X0_OPIVI|nr:DnaK family protein [Opisthorchis viverrini]
MAVSVVGFDVGCMNSYVAVAKGGGIETITNEYSDRQTPTCIAFAGRRRLIGTSAKLQHATNISNTFVNFLPLLGKRFADPSVVRERHFLPYRFTESSDGRVSLMVNFNESDYAFSPEQLLAMQLCKLRSITETALSSKVVDVVINVPTYYTDTERRAVLDASRICGLNCVKLVNDLTAVGTAYGLYKTDLPAAEQAPRIVAFVSVGYTSTQVGICAFNSGKMKVLATACDPHLGGRDFDRIIFDKLAEEFEAKYKAKVSENPKATVRLLQECEKVKKAMSANSQELPVNIECLMNDRDLAGRIKRADFEEWSSELLCKFSELLQRCLSLTNLKPGDLHSVELVGGSSRIPALKSIVADIFKQEGRTTLNADEAVARGCALQAAICSPAFRVRDFTVTEVCPYTIALHWDREDSGDHGAQVATENENEVTVGNKETSVVVFPALHPIPSSRRLFFNRRGPFTVEARYANPEQLPNQNLVLGQFRICDVPQKSNEVSKIRVKVRINSHGIFAISQAEVAEEHEKEVEVEVPEEKQNPIPTPTNGKSMDVETPGNGDVAMETPVANATNEVQEPNAVPESVKKPVPKKTTVKKKVVKYKELPVEASIMQYSTKQLNEFCETEGKLSEQDELEHRRAHAKNAVEEYVYEMRSKLQEILKPFATHRECEDLSKALEDTEDWLYGDGEDLHRQAYVDRLNQMKTLGDPIEMRELEQRTRTDAVQSFQQSIVHIRKVLDSVASGEEKYSHLTAEQLGQLRSELTRYESWLHEQLRIQNARPLTEDPSLKTADILKQQQGMESVCHPIINTPKPAPTPPPQPTENADVNHSNENNVSATEKGNKKDSQAKTPEKSDQMDVD